MKAALFPALAGMVWACVAPAAVQAAALSDRELERAMRRATSARLPAASDGSGRRPGQAWVLTRTDIEASGASTVQELLARIPGVVLYDQVGNSFQQTVDLRGFNGSPAPATVVLLDGVRMNEPDLGQVNFHLIPVSDLERVEVLPGASTVLGRGAMAGAVHLYTRRAGRKSLAEAEAALGSFGRRELGASLEGPLDGWSYRLAGRTLTELGYRSHSYARLHNFSGRLERQHDDWSASLSYRFAEDELRQPGSLTASELGADRRRNVSAVETDSLFHLAVLDLRRRLAPGLAVSLQGSSRARLERTPLNRGRSSTSRSRADMVSRGAIVQLDDESVLLGRRSSLAAGVEGAYERADSDSSGAFGAFPFVSGSVVRQRHWGLFVQEKLDLWPEAVSLTAGWRYDRTSLDYQDKTASANNGDRLFERPSLLAGVSAMPVEGVEVFLARSEAFRTPTASELSALGPFESSPDLRPVKAVSWEAGLRLRRSAALELDVSAFRTAARDEIYPVFDPTAGFGQNQNVERTLRRGVEARGAVRGSIADLEASYAYTEATFETAFTLDKPPFGNTQAVTPGRLLPQVPRHRFFAELRLKPAAGATLAARTSCFSSRHVFGDEANLEPRLGGVCLFGLGAALERGAWRLYAQADNVLDRRYESRGILATNPATGGLERFLVPAAGVAVRGAIRYRFDWSGP